MVRIFEEHVAQCAARAAEAQVAPDSLELRALRPKHTSYKIYIMAVKAARWEPASFFVCVIAVQAARCRLRHLTRTRRGSAMFCRPTVSFRVLRLFQSTHMQILL